MINRRRLEEVFSRRPSRWGNLSIKEFEEDIKILQKEAKRVQDLEDEIDRLNGALHYQLRQENLQNEKNRKLRHKNKHYREIMEKSKKAIQANLQRWNYKDEEKLYEAYKELEKALEGSE